MKTPENPIANYQPPALDEVLSHEFKTWLRGRKLSVLATFVRDGILEKIVEGFNLDKNLRVPVEYSNELQIGLFEDPLHAQVAIRSALITGLNQAVADSDMEVNGPVVIHTLSDNELLGANFVMSFNPSEIDT